DVHADVGLVGGVDELQVAVVDPDPLQARGRAIARFHAEVPVAASPGAGFQAYVWSGEADFGDDDVAAQQREWANLQFQPVRTGHPVLLRPAGVAQRQSVGADRGGAAEVDVEV